MSMPEGQAKAYGPAATHGRKSTYKRGCRGVWCQLAMGHPKAAAVAEPCEAGWVACPGCGRRVGWDGVALAGHGCPGLPVEVSERVDRMLKGDVA